MVSTDASDRDVEPAVLSRNEVRLVGRLNKPAEERELPSGDLIVTFCVAVDRPPERSRRGVTARRAVDPLDCVAWTAAARRSARGLSSGDLVSVEGSLRRRFWQGGPGVSSRCEVLVTSVRKLRTRPVSAAG